MVNPVQPLAGQKFYLLVGDGATPTEAFTFACILTTIDSDHGAEVEDAMAPDCDDPTAIPTRTSTVKMLTWDITASGLVDPTKAPYVQLRTAFRSGAPINLQLKKNLTGANGGETEQQAFLITQWKESKSENGLVKCQMTFHGQGKPTVTVNP
ncbi:phage tail tube protein [Methylocystis parvus]|uniref:phage tail tube protein n=1 Tax=Methylocystis parvus TaxID=134 RepID=UPI003C7617FB